MDDNNEELKKNSEKLNAKMDDNNKRLDNTTLELKKDNEELRRKIDEVSQQTRKDIEAANQEMYKRILKKQDQVQQEFEEFKNKTKREVEESVDFQIQEQTSVLRKEWETWWYDEREEINHEIHRKVDKVQKEVEKNKQEVEKKVEGMNNGTQITVGKIVEERKLPTYSASNKGTHPQEFLEALERHFKIRGTPDDRKLDFAIDQLEGDVSIWAQNKKSKWKNWGDLQRDLLEMYWSDNVQKRVLAELLRPRLYNAKLGTMTHHAWYWVKKTQYMDPPVGQKLLIEALIRHYPTEVEDILLGATIETVKGLINLLERIQARDKMSNSRDNRHEHPRNLHHMNRGRGQGQDRGHGRGGRYRNRSLSSGPGNEEMQK